MEILDKVKAFIDAQDSASIEEFVAENRLKNVSLLSDAAVRALPLDSHAEAFLLRHHRLDIDQNESIIIAKSSDDGNCLYNSCSLAISGSEDLSHLLRALTSAGLFLFSEFYASHPHFITNLATSNQKDFMETFFSRSFTFSPNDLLVTNRQNFSDAIKSEASLNCVNGHWSPFICFLGLSSVLGLPIHSIYPDNGRKNSVKICHAQLLPRENLQSANPVRILWTTSGGPKDDVYPSSLPNHVVPIFVVKGTHKRASSSSAPNPKKIKQSKLFFPPKPAIVMQTEEEIVQEDSFAILSRNEVTNTGKDLSGDPPVESSSQRALDFDIGSISLNANSLNDSQKYDVLKNVWKPDENFSFPSRVISGKKRKFVSSWFQQFPWLVYSKKFDGAFCVACVLFGRKTGANASKLDKLMKSPFVDWSCASRRFQDHTKNDVHKASLLTMQTFTKVKENKITPINQIHDTILDRTISKNRDKLAPIVKTVLLCARHNIPLRGHRDDSDNYETDNCGNFQALLDFRVDSGDKVLEEHFQTAPRNATYRSKTTQNELISCCAETVTKQIIEEVKESKFYSILADEVTDCSNKEQMPLVLRYVDKEGEIQERFIKFIHCDKGVSGMALQEKITKCINEELKLDIKDCRGQCYDGAGNMAGKYSGVATRILQENNLALYTHCASHKLNLCVAAACKVQNVRNMMDNIQVISKFFSNSPKKQLLLEEMTKKLMPEYKHTKLIDVCRTRWVLRLDGLARFLEMYIPITEALFTIRDNADRKWDSAAAEAHALAAVCSNFDFLMTLVIVRNCLGYTRSVTIQLQGAHIDIIEGLKQVDIMMKSLNTARNLIDSYHETWFQKATEIANEIGAPITNRRICRRQVNRSNIPAESVKDYFKRNVSIKFLDHLISEMSTRFTQKNCIAMKGTSIIPAILKNDYKCSEKKEHEPIIYDESDVTAHSVINEDQLEENIYPEPTDTTDGQTFDAHSSRKSKVDIQRLDKQWKRDFRDFCVQYEKDLPNISNLSHEVDNWESAWKDVPDKELPCSITQTIKKTNALSFPNIFTALKILAVLPVTSCTCERSASSIRLLKTYLRSTMSQERLNGLASLYTHKDIKVNVDKAIDIFGRRHNRRMTMINILNSDVTLQNEDDVVSSELY